MTVEELRKLINQADRENWNEVDLSGLDLVELPSEIGDLHKLKILKLGYNQTTKKYNNLNLLPTSMTNLTNLQVLIK